VEKVLFNNYEDQRFYTQPLDI